MKPRGPDAGPVTGGASLDSRAAQDSHPGQGEVTFVHGRKGGVQGVELKTEGRRRCHVDGEEALVPDTLTLRRGLVSQIEIKSAHTWKGSSGQ